MVFRLKSSVEQSGGLAKKVRLWNRRRIDARRQKRREERLASLEGQLAVVGIMKNESMILDEWLQHYLSQGADKIILIDNGSTDNSAEIVKKYSEGGKVEYEYRPEKWRQVDHYRAVIKKHDVCRRFQWLLIADLDEFWFEKSGKRLSDTLSSYKEFDVIYANWSIFGSNGHRTQPANVRESFVMRWERLGPHDSTKWICRTDALKELSQLHLHKIYGVCSSKTISDNQVFQVNHYMVQSKE